MFSHRMATAAVTTLLAAYTFSAQAQTTGGLTCPKGKVVAKSFGAYYVPAQRQLTIFFYKEAVTDEEMDAILANASTFDAGDKAKGPGTGKPNKYVPYAFKAWMRVVQKPGGTVSAADVAKSAYFSYVCD